ncbi:hypothetical protein CC86DRAFT_468981 [Ophiobolus disseminans]|uniref:Uncharacterized protein n=1 Tax=Ophiobolus disseminans TaxID=1469910 RepID=A0A6A6ZSH2_9PLEO|nr:hypothetical protein CC86DRAFT_468981 [Ophiobolus disseminans]
MASPYRDNASSDLPEVNYQEQSYAYALPDQTAAEVLPSTKGYYSSATESHHVPTVTTGRKGWMRWWVIALIGLFIAIIAGLVGGLIGQAIQKGRASGSSDSTLNSSQEASPSPSSCPNSTSAATTPPPGAPANAIGTILTPDTGCDWPSSKERRRIAKQTTYLKGNYTTICNSGWLGNDGILGLWTLSPSDCVEACLKYNSYAVNRPASERRCVGAGFIPDWTNQTTGAREQKGAPFNCYMMSSNKNIVPNDRADFGTEVVSLCLDGQCNGIGSS